jgi:hypothetical protein
MFLATYWSFPAPYFKPFNVFAKLFTTPKCVLIHSGFH